MSGVKAGSKKSSQSQMPPSKKLKQNPSAETAVKSCRDNLKGYTEDEIYITKNASGATAYEDVLAGVRQHKHNPEFPLGGPFYASIRARHPKKIHDKQLLVVPQPKEDIPDDLLRAVIATKKAKPDHSLILTWLGSNEATNVTTIIGLTRWMMTINPAAKTHASAAQAFTRFLARTNVADKYPDYYAAFYKEFADQTVLTAWKIATAPSLTTKASALSFCTNNGVMCSAVFPKDALKNVLDAEGEYGPVESDLTKIVSCGTAGLKIWSFALVQLLAERMDKVI